MQLFLPIPRLLYVSLLSLLASSPVLAQVNSGNGTSSSNSTANTDADNNANDNDNIVVDLTQEWKVGNIDNPDAKFFESLLERDIRRMLVVQSGEIVMEYERDNVEKDEIYNLFSATKTMMSVLMGVLLESEEYNLTVTDTLGDVFPNEYAWSNIKNVTEVECKKTATIEELLTMTSGLTAGVTINVFDEKFTNPWDIPNSFGKDLPDSLFIPDCDAELRGTFVYKTNSNILSYVIKEVTNLSPKEFADATIFPALGINATDWEWDANEEGIQTSYSHMRLTARQMAKFAQLYLQKGYSSPGNVLLSEEWVDTSLSKQIWAGDNNLNNFFGNLWHLYDAESWHWFRNNATTPVNSIWCASGVFGQFACLCEEMDRVVVIQRSNTVYDYRPYMLTHVLTDAFNTTATFTSPPSTTNSSTNSSAASPTMKTPVVLSASSSSSSHGLLLSYGSSFCVPAAAVAVAALALSIIIL